MAPRTRIQPTHHSDINHEDFTAALAAVPDESDSTDDDTHLPPNLPPAETEYHLPNPGLNASEDDLRAALRELQTTFTNVRLQLRDAHIKIFKLEREVKEYKRQLPSKGKASAGTKQRANASTTLGPVHAKADRIGLYARKFTVMNEYLVVPAAFLVQRPEGLRSDDLCRWNTEEDTLRGIIVKLYEELPEDLHDMLLSLSSFRALFLSKLNAFRRSIIHQFRSETIFKIFNRDALWYSPTCNRKDILEFQNEIIFPGKDKFTLFPPIIFPNRERNMRLIFKCKHLALMLQTILFGPVSLEKQPENTCTYATLWNVKAVTPGAIAFVAVLAIFFHSEDKKFSPVGSESRIRYAKLFAKYKQVLVTGLASGVQRWIDLMNWYNSEVFAWSDDEICAADASTIAEALEDSGDDEQWNEVSFQGNQMYEDEFIGRGADDGDQGIELQLSSHSSHLPTASNVPANTNSLDTHLTKRTIQFAEPQPLDDSNNDFYGSEIDFTANIVSTSTPQRPQPTRSVPVPSLPVPSLPLVNTSKASSENHGHRQILPSHSSRLSTASNNILANTNNLHNEDVRLAQRTTPVNASEPLSESHGQVSTGGKKRRGKQRQAEPAQGTRRSSRHQKK